MAAEHTNILTGNGGVEGQIAFEEQAVGLALLGNHGKAVLDGLLGARFPPVDNAPGGPILSVQHLSTKFAPHLQDITFDVRNRPLALRSSVIMAKPCSMASLALLKFISRFLK